MDELTRKPILRRSPPASVEARHISAEGCQFVTGSGQLSRGERFAFVVNESDRVAGTVRWVVRDRAGFAFDAPIAGETLAALRARTQNYGSVELHQD
ncbi:MAG TPA: PilZ domain-containing protein [Novosphingobium sp.]|nr:PilZ domain-containing protein [Novosphingobium sp.]